MLSFLSYFKKHYDNINVLLIMNYSIFNALLKVQEFMQLPLFLQDVKWLASQLGNVRGCFRVDDPLFTHGDFFWSNRAPELVYNSLLSHLPLN